jgi:hypothetical protein
MAASPGGAVMNKKHIYFLAAFVIGLILLVTSYQVGERSESSRDGGLILDGFAAQANNIRRVELQFPDDQERFAILRKGDTWVVDVRDDYRADFAKLAVLVAALAEARIVEEKTSNPDNYAQLGVDDPAAGGSGTHVTLSGEGFEYELIVGKSAQGVFRYARVPSDQTSYLVDQALDMPSSPDDWLVKEIVDLAADRIRRVTITHADGETITIEKQSAEDANYSAPNIPAGRELSYPSVGNSIAGALSGLTFEAVRKARAAEPATTTVLETWDGLTVTASIVSEDDGNWLSISALAAESEDADTINERLAEWQYRIADFKMNQLTRHWEDILKSDDKS